MVTNKTIFIAHGWSDISVNFQSKALALSLSKNNKVFFLNTKKNPVSGIMINENLVINQWPGKRPVGWRDLWFAIKQVKLHRPDIIITNFAANDIMLFVSWMFRVKTRICYFHTMVQQYIADHEKLDYRQRVNIFRKGFIFRMATHMLTPTGAAKSDLIKYYNVRKSKAYIFPNALPGTNFRNTGNYNSVAFLGRLDRSKGVDILIEAFKEVSKKLSDVRLVIAGNGAMEEELKHVVEIAALTDKILFKGYIPYHEVPEFLASVNFLVVPSRIDNLPTVALEALSVATPVIGSNAGGIPEIIQPGYNGYLFESGNIEDLSQKMMQLFLNPRERDRISANARQSFEEKYSVDNWLLRFEDLIEDRKMKE